MYIPVCIMYSVLYKRMISNTEYNRYPASTTFFFFLEIYMYKYTSVQVFNGKIFYEHL